VFLGPAVDIARAPRASRTFEAFGGVCACENRHTLSEILREEL
jgi:beta-glucosidase-like glycosyl hydrolase